MQTPRPPPLPHTMATPPPMIRGGGLPHTPHPPSEKTQTTPLPFSLPDGNSASGNVPAPDREGGLIAPEGKREGGSPRFQTQQAGGYTGDPPTLFW